MDIAELLTALRFDSTTRLYRLQADVPDLADLLVEAWSLRESLSRPWRMEISALSTTVGIDLHALLGHRVTLQTALADGTLYPRSGIVTAADAEDADGGFARYRLTVQPWMALLAHTRQSRVWQEKNLVEIVESVFLRYAACAQWRWADDVAAHLAVSPFNGSGRHRSYTVQYRETDLAFVTRLLAEEGIAWRVDEDAQAPAGNTVVFFADSPAASSCPEDASSAGGGIRFHRAASTEQSDAIQVFGGLRTLQAAFTTVLSYDYVARRAVAASVPTHHAFGGPSAPWLESYEPGGAYAFATAEQARRAGTLLQEAREARNKTWIGRGSVRTFSCGTTFALHGSPLDVLASLDADDAWSDLNAGGSGAPRGVNAGSKPGDSGTDQRFLLIAVNHAGINNLPKELSRQVAALQGEGRADLLAPWIDAEVRVQAATSGYGNAFQAIRAFVPWRVAPVQGARPTVDGPLVATVVGPGDGGGSAAGPGAGASAGGGRTNGGGGDNPAGSAVGDIHTDRLGRIRIRHDFQAEGGSSSWVRVLQRFAGPGVGMQFLPRIGQQVLVDFSEGDIDRPFVVGALYDGRGEGGVAVTPGGRTAEADRSVFGQSGNHRPSAQGNTTGGHSPPWHGASPEEHADGGQRNAAALSGWKTQEFGGVGFNQLVFDDSPQQLRVQFATTQHASQLNLGHLIHQADNHRGSFRGLGFELRTDAYGSLRAGQGVLLSSYGTQAAEPAGDNAAGIALAGQSVNLWKSLSEVARVHQTVQLAGHIGSVKAGASAVNDREAPVQAVHTALKGMVDAQSLDAASADAGQRTTATSGGRLPHTADAVVTVSAKAGLVVTAGQDMQMVAADSVHLGAGQDMDLAAGGAVRVHTGQAIGMLAGAVGGGGGGRGGAGSAADARAAGTGITLIAGQGDIELQAQSDKLQVAARDDVTIQSANAHIDWAAAKRIVLSTAGGASITLEGGNITVQAPGRITVRAGKKSFVGPGNEPSQLPELPRHTMRFDEKFQLVDGAGDPLKNFRVELVKPDGSAVQVVSDGNGMLPLQQGFAAESLKIRVLSRAGRS